MKEKTLYPQKPLHKTSTSPGGTLKLSKKELSKSTKSLGNELENLQEMLYAEAKQKVLIILQGLDTSGKDGVVKHVFKSLNPQGLRVVSFKQPTSLEASHDYLWRIHKETPQLGEIVIFNRSHYEDFVVPFVHKRLPKSRLKKRLKEIRHFEDMLISEGVTLIKLFLHISPAEQAKRIQARLSNPQKHWKFSLSDLTEREHWNRYQEAYDLAFEETHAPHKTWCVVPADDKDFRDNLVSNILTARLKSLNGQFPAIDTAMIKKLKTEAKLFLTPKKVP